MALSIEFVRDTGPELRVAGSLRAVKPDGIVTFLSSTPDLDRHGTRILPLGIDIESYKRNPVFIWGHDGYGGLMGGPSIDSIIGRSISVTKDKTGLRHDVEFAPTESGQKAKALVTAGFCPATSIGFNPVRWHEEPNTRADGSKGPPVIVFDEVELLEISLVPIPSNPYTQALAVRALADAGLSPNLRGLVRDDDRSETWVRSETVATQSEPGEHPTDPTTQSESDEAEGTQSGPLVDLIRNLVVHPYQPTVGQQVIRTAARVRSQSWR